jgi:hypothetical protein
VVENEKSISTPQPYWNPYIAGIGLGLVLLAAFVIMGRGLGASGAFSTVVSTGINAVDPSVDKKKMNSSQPILTSFLQIHLTTGM